MGNLAVKMVGFARACARAGLVPAWAWTGVKLYGRAEVVLLNAMHGPGIWLQLLRWALYTLYEMMMCKPSCPLRVHRYTTKATAYDSAAIGAAV